MVRAEQGTDQTAFRNIPKKGGAVTVSGGSLPANSQIRVLGETVQTDPSGRFVLQRILPDGDHWVDVDLPGPQKNIKRKVEIPTKDMFLFALADVTLGLRNKSDGTGNELFDRSRLAFYMKSKQSNGWTITAALDTGEEDLGNLLSGVLEKDPRSLVSRIDPQDLYPSYGDDSTSVDDTPTDGRIYLKAEYETGFILWGNYKASLGRNTYVRNERQLYGAQVNWKFGEDTPEKNHRGAARQRDQPCDRAPCSGARGGLHLQLRARYSAAERTAFRYQHRRANRAHKQQLCEHQSGGSV